jgi:hypothetical protein
MVTRLAEQHRELRPPRAERRGGRDRDIELERARQEECAVDGGLPSHVPVVDDPQLALQALRPLRGNVLRLEPIRDAERKVDVGPAVLAASGA